jgi:hypothetical protein
VVKGKKQVKGKWNFLLMRPQGEVTNFAVSPVLLAVALLFSLVFAAGAVLSINRYFSLYLEYQEVAESRRELQARLNQLDGQYRYQISLTQDYAELLNELDGTKPILAGGLDPVELGDAVPEASSGGSPSEAVSSEMDFLDAWVDRLPALAGQPGESLHIVDFRREGNRFSFQLINETPGSLARGRILTLFLVENQGRLLAVPFPDFDPQASDPDFETGLGYNIRASKHFNGQLNVPVGSRILAMMAVAQSIDGHIVMKKRIMP